MSSRQMHLCFHWPLHAILHSTIIYIVLTMCCVNFCRNFRVIKISKTHWSPYTAYASLTISPILLMRSHHFISDLLFCNSTSSKSVMDSFYFYPLLFLGQTSTVDGALSELWFPAAYIIIVYFKDLSLNSRYLLYSAPLTLSKWSWLFHGGKINK